MKAFQDGLLVKKSSIVSQKCALAYKFGRYILKFLAFNKIGGFRFE